MVNVASYGQYVIASVIDPLDQHHVISPEVILTGFNKQLALDIDGDGTDDLTIDHTKFVGSMATGSWDYTRFLPLNNTQISSWYIDSCSTHDSIPVYDRGMTTKFFAGDTIDEHVKWVNNTVYLRYFDKRPSFQGSISGYHCSRGPNYSTGSHYIGIRLPSISDTIYAWLRIDLAAYDTTIVHSFNHDTGQKINLKENKYLGFQVYPNPVYDLLHVQLNDMQDCVLEINIIDGRGTELYSTRSRDKSIDIDLSFYPAGVYFLQIYDGAEIYEVERINKTTPQQSTK